MNRRENSIAEHFRAIEPELPVDRANRLGMELALALDEWDGGRWKASVMPESKGQGATVAFVCIKSDDHARHDPTRLLQLHMSGVKRAMMEIDPTVTEWTLTRPVDDADEFCISLSGSRKAVNP